MSLDLNSSLGFAKATLSGASSILNQFAGLNNEQWDIQESAYGHNDTGLVIFHIFKTPANYSGAVEHVQDTISRRVIPFEYPYVEGQTTDDLGRKGNSHDFDILLFGDGYYQAYLNLIKEFNDPRPGTLVHPVFGPLTAKFDSSTILHQSSQKKAVALRVRFVEHNFDISFAAAKPTTKSALAKAVGFISKITNIINKIDSNLNVLSQIRSAISTALKTYSSDYTVTLVAMNTTFNSGTSADIPGLLPNNSSSSTAFPSATDPNDPFAGATPEQIQAQQSPALASLQAIDLVTALRVKLNALIQLMESANGGQGALIFYDDILSLKQSSLAIQKTLELGLQSSNATIKKYKVPRLMSLREVCFANNLAVDRAIELEILNPDIQSANFIDVGSVLQVPTS